MAPQVELVVEPVWMGEGPHWDQQEQALYFVSVYDQTVHKYVPSTNTHTRTKIGDGKPSFIIPVEGKKDHFVVSLNRDVLEIEWSGEDDGAKILRKVVELDEDHSDNRINDGKADPRGRLFTGSLGYEYELNKFKLKRGRLYRVDADGSATRLDDGIDLSNGLCWDVAGKAFYYADSFEYVVRRYDYDIETGSISNRTTVFKYADHGLVGIVDGMTIDTDGNLWIANYNNSQVIKIDPRVDKILQRIPIPALQVTSVTFGGPNLDELYVTTGAKNRGKEQLPPCGATFRVTGLGVKGHPSVKVRLN